MLSLLRPVQSGTLGLLVLALTISASSLSGEPAQQKPTQRKQPAPTQAKQTTAPNKAAQAAQTQAIPTRRSSDAIEIRIETFRKQIVTGTPMGVTADITNNSNAPVYLRQRDVQLVLPPEVEGQIYSTDGWFPTEYCLEGCPKDCPLGCPQPSVISLRPTETYRVFWGRSSRKQPHQLEASWFCRRWPSFCQSINFTPGVYRVTVEAKYWDQDPKEKLGGDDYHTVVQTKDAEFVAPQWVILLGAALGGVMFTILSMIRAKEKPANGAPPEPQHPAKSWGKGLVKGLLIVAGSILLSVIITILLSRIEQTQFFIKVTVSDFWGAIAIGFLANYGGWALLDKMLPAGEKEDKTKKDSTKGQTQTGTGSGATT